MRALILAVTCLLLTAGTATSQVFEIGGFGGTHSSRSDAPVNFEDGWMLGIRMAFNTRRFLGHEFGYSYNRTALNRGAERAGTGIHRGFYNFLVYAMPEGARVRIFGAGGLHIVNHVFPDFSDLSGGGSTKLGVNYGGGFKVMMTPLVGFRFDFRDYRNPKPFAATLPGVSGWMSQIEVSAGLQILL